MRVNRQQQATRVFVVLAVLLGRFARAAWSHRPQATPPTS
jgi:hypothetical protein